jgi:hypothetical protein
MSKLILSVLLVVGLAHAATPQDKSVLVMDKEDGGFWRGFETNKECLGLHAIRMSDHETFRWALAIAGTGRGNFEVLLTEMPTKHNMFFGTNIPKGMGRACKTIKEAINKP